MTSASDLSDKTTMVVGASCALGRGIATTRTDLGRHAVVAYAAPSGQTQQERLTDSPLPHSSR